MCVTSMVYNCRYYGCQLTVPELLEGAFVLDLGCGAGMECFLLSGLVGEKGHVTGVDMTTDQVVNLHYFPPTPVLSLCCQLFGKWLPIMM